MVVILLGMKRAGTKKRREILYEDISYADETYGDVTYGDVLSLYHHCMVCGPLTSSDAPPPTVLFWMEKPTTGGREQLIPDMCQPHGKLLPWSVFVRGELHSIIPYLRCFLCGESTAYMYWLISCWIALWNKIHV